ncbi:MAG TPA: ATPase [Ktedonobacter sp.]|jgi:simple sugar transport system permease protein|nr:ATPase [Ktedonobacter sp.]HAG97471.1 ATPase [Ktedonobacter sp.]
MSKSTVERPVNRQGQTVAGTLRRHGRHIIGNWVRELALLPVIVLLIIIGAIVNPSFLTTDNFINVAQLAAPLGVVVVAETLILLTGKFDLSLQSMYGLAPMVGAWLIVSKDGQGLGTNWNPYLGIAIVLLVGLVVGAFNGFMVIKLGFNAFIFTLAMLILLAGIQVGIVNGRTIYHLPPEFTYVGSQNLLGVPVSVWVTGAIFLLAALFLRYHRVGRAIYAIGGNTEAARAAGIHVDRIRIGVFIVASLLAALAGLMTAGEVAAVTAGQGNNLIFQVFAAAVIGGISLDGGRGRMVGALTGVILLALVSNILILSQVQTFWIDAANGLIILIALGLARLIGSERA